MRRKQKMEGSNKERNKETNRKKDSQFCSNSYLAYLGGTWKVRKRK